MNLRFPQSRLTIALAAVLAVAGCSSSNDDDPVLVDGPAVDGVALPGEGQGSDGDDSASPDSGDSDGGSGTDSPDGQPDDAVADAFALDESIDALITSLAGYQIEALSEEVLQALATPVPRAS